MLELLETLSDLLNIYILLDVQAIVGLFSLFIGLGVWFNIKYFRNPLWGVKSSFKNIWG